MLGKCASLIPINCSSRKICLGVLMVLKEVLEGSPCLEGSLFGFDDGVEEVEGDSTIDPREHYCVEVVS